jgi:hypothetical protein
MNVNEWLEEKPGRKMVVEFSNARFFIELRENGRCFCMASGFDYDQAYWALTQKLSVASRSDV